MKTKLFALALIFGCSFSAHAQDYGVILGVHQTTASADGASVNGEFNFRLGFAASFPLTDMWSFRSGIMYTTRHFDATSTVNGLSEKATFKMEYIDIPLLAQVNLTHEFGIFGGLVAAINTSKSETFDDGTPGKDVAGNQGFIPLAQLGINGTFNDQFGLEVYYERGLGSFADHLSAYSSYGLNFLYWF